MDSIGNEQQEAAQAVVDRVGAYQDGAEERVVADELRAGFQEAGVEATEDDVRRLADAIEANDGPVTVTEQLGNAAAD
jgi:hypothetical protein